MAKQYAEYLVVNDLERYSCVTNHCYLSNESEVPVREIERWRAFINEFIRDEWAPGFITELYSPVDEEAITASDRVFYTRRNAIFLDVTCQAIGRVPEHLRCYFLAPLLSQASVHVNTSGVFKGFYKSPAGIGQYGGRGRDALARILKDISLPSPIFSNFECPIEVFQSNANDLVRQIDGMDLAYLDPPYNQHPYGSNYFMLNLLCEYRRPDVLSRVSGIPVNWNRSPYNKPQEAEAALFDAIQNCRAKFVLLSYNSEGFVSHQHLLKKLQEIGDVSVFDRRYNTFRGSRNLAERDMHVTEFLYMLDKR
jgi:adenine-specific DNA-methyltransferase